MSFAFLMNSSDVIVRFMKLHIVQQGREFAELYGPSLSMRSIPLWMNPADSSITGPLIMEGPAPQYQHEEITKKRNSSTDNRHSICRLLAPDRYLE
jgi:hypothetical protein